MICTCVVLGWSHYFLPESESSWVLSIPSGYRGLDLHVKRQRDNQSSRGCCDFSVELMGCISIHEYSCEPEKESSRTLSCLAYVCICGFPHRRHQLIEQCGLLLVNTWFVDQSLLKPIWDQVYWTCRFSQWEFCINISDLLRDFAFVVVRNVVFGIFLFVVDGYFFSL